VVHPEDRERVKRTFQLIAGEGFESATTEYRMQRKDGTYSLFEARLTAIRDPAGEPTRILVVARDISEREAAEKERQRIEVQLRHAQKLESIGQLAAGVAHEINTPTQYIGDNLRFIHDAFKDVFSVIDEAAAAVAEAGSPAGPGLLRIAQRSEAADLDYLRGELPKAIEQSLEGVNRVAKIVGAMKAFSHPGGEDKAPADLNHAIESTITVSRNEWKYVADLVLDLDRDLPEVPCLLGEVNQVVLNLVVNAAHAISDAVGRSGKKGTITVRTRREEGWVAVEVGDTGGGIPVAIQGRVFDPFFTTKEVGRGSGQGLSIAHSVVVDKHGGTIQFESEEGKGTVFTFRLPLAGKAPKE
jgi:signal transduction histidine kinase